MIPSSPASLPTNSIRTCNCASCRCLTYIADVQRRNFLPRVHHHPTISSERSHKPLYSTPAPTDRFRGGSETYHSWAPERPAPHSGSTIYCESWLGGRLDSFFFLSHYLFSLVQVEPDRVIGGSNKDWGLSETPADSTPWPRWSST